METPALYFRTDVIENNLANLRAAFGPDGKILFSVKAFPELSFLEFIDPLIDGFDVSNNLEIDLISHLKATLISVAGPMAVMTDRSFSGKNSLVYANSIDDLKKSHSGRGNMRICVTDFVNKKSFVHGSRFGVRKKELMSAIEKFDRLAFHFHAPASKMVNRNMMSGFLKFLKHFGIDLSRIEVINLGGGWGGTSFRRLKILHDFIKKEIACEVHIEPGSGLLAGAGLAMTRVLNCRKVGDTNYVTLDLSPELHLRWSSPAFLDQNLHGADRILLCGPTCFEGDYVEVRGNFDAVCASEVIVLEGIVSYSSSWNTSFNGISQVPVIID